MTRSPPSASVMDLDVPAHEVVEVDDLLADPEADDRPRPSASLAASIGGGQVGAAADIVGRLMGGLLGQRDRPSARSGVQ